MSKPEVGVADLILQANLISLGFWCYGGHVWTRAVDTPGGVRRLWLTLHATKTRAKLQIQHSDGRSFRRVIRHDRLLRELLALDDHGRWLKQAVKPSRAVAPRY